MAATIKKMGKVAASPFGALTKGTAAKPNNKPILILIVVGGVAVIWYLRNHSSSNTVGSSTTNPAVSINGGTAPDQSTIDNLTASILALQGQVYNSTTTPSGGASTPITTAPVTTTPAAAVVNNPTPSTPVLASSSAVVNNPTPSNNILSNAGVVNGIFSQVDNVSYVDALRQRSMSMPGSQLVTDTAGRVNLLASGVTVPSGWQVQSVSQGGAIVPSGQGAAPVTGSVGPYATDASLTAILRGSS